ncbi:Putative 115 kDa protein in type-1 retrotransposable element R1DM [Eumeta japonica]|uniref:115 kDa protein in type-1 retrotransposable element R1DM n=1 Tax=Eumeta variegata TaxID=151549 RepID=A0A4C1TJ98_EUMVA|nr:Putative 115 kDa protein in type-1 retrotransposable element R1DM [Eumeta japonica]
MKYDDPVVHMNGEKISLIDEIRLVGLTIDRKLTFIPHVAKACKKAVNIYKGSARTARATWGLSPEIVRTVHITVTEPIILYASCTWARATEKLGVRKMLDAVQRIVALKACLVHRTVSLHSALILSRLLPLDIRVREAAWLYKVKCGKDLGDTFVDRELEKPVYFGDLSHPAHVPDIRYESVEDMDCQTLVSPGGVDLSEIVAEGRAVRLFWIRAHVGIAETERAVELARRTALTKKTAADYDKFPLSYAKKVIRVAILEEWQELYAEGSTGEITKCFFPRVEQAYRVLRKIEMTSQIAQNLM